MLQLHRAATVLLVATAAAANAAPTSCSGDTSSTDAVQAILDSDQSPSKTLESYLKTLPNKEDDWVRISGRAPKMRARDHPVLVAATPLVVIAA